jgi:heptosyltransferase-2
VKSILFIRGGALGDFIVTLPALRLVREKWPKAHIELLGYPRHAILGLKRYYLDAVRSVNSGPLAGFFIPNAVLDPDLVDYFGDFDLVVSYFYDPDLIFQNNLKRCNMPNLLTHSPVAAASPAARHYCEPLRQLGLETDDFSSRLYLSLGDYAEARDFLKSGFEPGDERPLVALHPGSGSEKKNWPIENWIDLCHQRVKAGRERFLIVCGEADDERVQRLLARWPGLAPVVARQLPLPQLAGILSQCKLLVGHDSGVTHLAAAVGCQVVALFGPSNASMWTPPGSHVRVIQKGEDLAAISVEDVAEEMDRR